MSDTVGKVPKTEMALPRSTETSMRCLKLKIDLGSPETTPMRRQSSRMRSTAAGSQTPMVSTATGANAYERARSRYLDIFRDSAEDAAAPADNDVCGRCEGARVSGQVKSHTRDRPRDHGSKVMYIIYYIIIVHTFTFTASHL